jgi:hypothetical protein
VKTSIPKPQLGHIAYLFVTRTPLALGLLPSCKLPWPDPWGTTHTAA